MKPKIKPDYGWDGSPVKLALFLLVSFGIGSWLIVADHTSMKIVGGLFSISGLIMALLAFLWIHYVKRGKFLRRDRMLALIKWTGNEIVLDVGTGRGLLMIGAAKKLGRGKSVGIDIWNPEDMLNNHRDKTLLNAQIEGVLDKCEIKDEDAQSLSFPTLHSM